MLEDYLKIKNPEFNINNTLPVARPGLPFIFIGLAAFLLFWALGWCVLTVIFLVLSGLTVWFFRDPARPTPPAGFGLSPADGQIIRIEELAANPYFDGPATKISIFMNILSVHVNRLPVGARLVRQDYYPGSFLNASLDKASENNERNALVLEAADGSRLAVVQVAGLIARRIISWVKDGDQLERGQRFGMIRFGSRVDVYLPQGARVMVALGQKVHAGTTPIWDQAAV